jgi:hypothetical protein
VKYVIWLHIEEQNLETETMSDVGFPEPLGEFDDQIGAEAFVERLVAVFTQGSLPKEYTVE